MKRARLLIGVVCAAVMVSGCETVARKFTRKSKKAEVQEEAMVVAPQEYPVPVISKEDQYRQYYVFWKSWHDELIEELTNNTNPKKHLSCAREALMNLSLMAGMLAPEPKAKLEVVLQKFEALRTAIAGDISGLLRDTHRAAAEQLKRTIMQNFSYAKIKDTFA